MNTEKSKERINCTVESEKLYGEKWKNRFAFPNGSEERNIEKN